MSECVCVRRRTGEEEEEEADTELKTETPHVNVGNNGNGVILALVVYCTLNLLRWSIDVIFPDIQCSWEP